MDRPVHLIVRLPYDRPPNAPRDPIPVEWTPQKEQFLWEVLSRSRGPDRAGVDWQHLAEHLATPLPYLLYRAQMRYEEDLRGLRDIRGTLALQLGAPATAADIPTPLATPLTSRAPSSNPNVQRGTSGGTPRTVSSRGSATPQRLTTPLAGPSRTTPFREVPAALAKGQSREGLTGESTATLTQRPPALPLQENLARLRNVPLVRPQQQSSAHSSSASSTSGDEEDEVERMREDEELLGKRLKDLEKMMTSDMLGFARPPRSAGPTGPTTQVPLPVRSRVISTPSQPQNKGKGREIPLSGLTMNPTSSVSPPRGRPILSYPATKGVTGQASSHPSSLRSSQNHGHRQSDASSVASASQSPQGSIPSITSPTQSQSPRSSSVAASASPSAATQSRSPSNASSPIEKMTTPPLILQHIKRLSLDGTSPQLPPSSRGGRAASVRQGRAPASTKGGSSTHGSTPSSFSDISDMSIDGSALEDAYLSNIKGGASRLSLFARSQFGGGTRASGYRQ
ncbi:hypothetical protein FRB99_006287 [Tulasnella sp. 403]|nr:hypothetical protein FRB99_006287 [Tulasnella sp. 403]